MRKSILATMGAGVTRRGLACGGCGALFFEVFDPRIKFTHDAGLFIELAFRVILYVLELEKLFLEDRELLAGRIDGGLGRFSAGTACRKEQ